MLTYRCPEREDVAINAYDQLAGTQVWSPDEDFLSNLTVLGKLLLLQKKVMRDVALNNISYADGITDVTSDYSHRQACGVLTLKFCL